jgi:uncharacterized membrane protein
VKRKTLSLKRWLLQGIVITLPLLVTLITLYYGIIYTDAVLWFLWDLLPWDLLPWSITKPKFPGLGLVVFTAVLIIIGFLAESFIVSRAIKLFNWSMSKVPFIRNIYTTVHKVVQSLFNNKTNFTGVVLIEYPRKDVYALAFKTSNSFELFCEKTNKKLINIFFPTTPNPTSGYYLLIPEDDIIELDLTTEQAFKLIISAGIVN